jgi:hypothetical protein
MVTNDSPVSGKTHLFFDKKSVALPRIGTKACKDFFMSLNECNELFSFLTGLVARFDCMAERVEKALTLPDGRRIALIEDVGKPNLPRVKLTDIFREKHARFMYEILLVKLVENYLNYLASLLFEGDIVKCCG